MESYEYYINQLRSIDKQREFLDIDMRQLKEQLKRLQLDEDITRGEMLNDYPNGKPED